MGRPVPERRHLFFSQQVKLDDWQLNSLFLPQTNQSGCQLFDISDYLESCVNRNGTTGIQRVQEALVQELIDYDEQVLFVVVDQTYSRVWVLDREELSKLVGNGDLRSGPSILEERGQFAEALRNRSRIRPLNQRDLLVNIGAFWSTQYDVRFEKYLASSECDFIPLIYDLIPVDHPELCEKGTVDRFIRALPRVINNADCIITTSEFTKARIQIFGAAQELSLPRIDVVPLAHQLTPRAFSGHLAAGSSKLPGVGDSFVLCVGTVEPRKNHLRLVEIWAQLAKDISQMPVLLIVGKVGWIDPVALARMSDLAQATKKIVFAHGVSDSELASLYQQCMFTVFISVDEGWGLPIGESLAFGKICVAGRAGAMPEVGGRFAIYVNPFDDLEICRTLRSLIVGADRRHILEKQISQKFDPRDWRQVAADMITITRKY